MVIQLKQLFEVLGEQKSFDYKVPLEDLKPYESFPFISPIAIQANIKNRAGIVTLNFSTQFVMKFVCDRCLCEFEREFSYDFEHIVVRSLNTDNDDYVVCPESILNLDELAISNIILQLPTKILCKEDCKGLCYICGNDNNKSTCGCQKQ